MRPTAVGAGLFVAFVVFAVVAVGGIAAGDAATQEDANASFGAEVSSFMQANDVEAQDEVDRGMFNASLQRAETAEERRAIVEERTERLQRRHERLQELRENVSTDAPSPADVAVATRVDVGASSLERSANETERVARGVGVNTERLETIRQNASQLRGPEVAELARSVGGPPEDARGPPDDVPAADNSSNDRGADSPGNGSDRSGADNRSGSGRNSTNASGGGPPDHAGGGPDDPGNGNGNGDGDADGDTEADEQD